MTPDPIQRILDFPAALWSESEQRAIREYRATLHSHMAALVEQTEREDRNLSPEETERFNEWQAEFDRLR